MNTQISSFQQKYQKLVTNYQSSTNKHKTIPHLAEFGSLHLQNIASKPHSSKNQRITYQKLSEFIMYALQTIYQHDRIGIKPKIKQFLKEKSHDLKSKLHQRISLLEYLAESLKYRSMLQIEFEIRREWRKNLLLLSINTIWTRCMINHNFTSIDQFSQIYEQQRRLICNVTNYYFQTAFTILQAQKYQTFNHIYEQTTHHIIEDLKQWKQIYYRKLIDLLHYKVKIDDQQQLKVNFQSLQINPQYIDIHDKNNQLAKTTQLIQLLTQEYRIHHKISLLQNIRSTFLVEIQQNSIRLAQKTNRLQIKQLEKDDIIGCMIYCIVKAKAINLDDSLNIMNILMGKNSQLLSSKRADVSMADLQSATQYIKELVGTSNSIFQNNQQDKSVSV